jgi:hypothetical protein
VEGVVVAIAALAAIAVLALLLAAAVLGFRQLRRFLRGES